MKKLQQLRAKKGFTLVELIVVIAIIGVLAAILIPTMIGYVKSANITSADQTAASVRKEVANTISSLETKGGTTVGSGRINYTVTNSSGADAEFTFGAGSTDDTALDLSGNKPNGGTYTIDNLYEALKNTCEKDLKEVKAGGGMVVIENGVCIQVTYSSTAASAQKNSKFEASDWDTNDEGIKNGIIVGTNPKVYIDANTESSAPTSSAPAAG